MFLREAAKSGIEERQRLGVGVLATSDRSELDRAVAGLTESMATGPFRPVLGEWNRLRREDSLPSRQDFDPGRVVAWLSHLAILEALPGGDDFRYRLTGTRMDIYLGRNLTGKAVSTIDLQLPGTEFWILLQSCAAERRPVAGTVRYTGARGHMQDCSAMMLPWCTTGDAVGQVLLVQDFRSVELSTSYPKA